MKDLRRSSALRLAVSLPAVAAISYAVARADSPDLPVYVLGIPGMILGALLLMPDATAVAGERMQRILEARDGDGAYRSDVDAADTRIDEGDLEAAYRQLQDTALAFPDERAVWMRLFHLAFVRMNRPDLGVGALQTASDAGLDPDDMEMVLRTYELFVTRPDMEMSRPR